MITPENAAEIRDRLNDMSRDLQLIDEILTGRDTHPQIDPCEQDLPTTIIVTQLYELNIRVDGLLEYFKLLKNYDVI